MTGEPIVRCVICGSTNEVSEEAADQVNAAKFSTAYICPECSHKVKYESEQYLK